MNISQFSLNDLVVELNYVKEVLRCILHTIIFNRAIGLIQPVEEVVDFIDYVYVRVNDETIEKDVSEKVEIFQHMLKKKDVKEGKVIISFEHQPQGGWFSQKVCWERWLINIVLPTKENTGETTTQLYQDLHQRITQILRIVNDNKNHIPPLTTKEVTPFPYEISFPGSGEGWGAGFWKMFQVQSPLLSNDNFMS